MLLIVCFQYHQPLLIYKPVHDVVEVEVAIALLTQRGGKEQAYSSRLRLSSEHASTYVGYKSTGIGKRG